MKKNKRLSVVLLSIAVTATIATSAHAYEQPSKEIEVRAINGPETNKGLETPTISINEGTITNLPSNVVNVQPYVKKIEGSNVNTYTTGSATDITLFATVTFPDEVIDYNTTSIFNSSSHGDWSIAAGVEAWFQVNFDDNHHVEIGFRKSDGTKIVLFDGKAAGVGEIYKPTEDVTGSFYIRNKAAGAIVASNIRMTY